MAQKYTKNDSLLSKYILQKTSDGKVLPYMTVISKETGISIATISRYAKRKGFYSFAEMRATFNKNDNIGQFNDFGLVEYILDSKKIVLVSSTFSSFIGEYLYSRLKYLKIPVELIGKDDFTSRIKDIDKNESIICISLTGWSWRIDEVMKKNKEANIFLITMAKFSNKNKKNVKVTQLHKEDDPENFEGYGSLRKLFIWLDDCLNILHLRLK